MEAVLKCLSFFAKFAFAIAIYLAIGWGLLWALPYTVILLILFAMAWYFARNGKWSRFSLRNLFVFVTGLAAILAVAVLVPAPMAGWGGWGKFLTKQISIEVVDRITKTPIKNAEVELTSRAAKKPISQHSKTNAAGTAKFSSNCDAATNKSILRVWTTYRTSGWMIEVKAAGYTPSQKTLPDIKVRGKGGGPLSVSIELEPKE